MTNLSKERLAELRERVEKASGSDRDLDRDICIYLDPEAAEPDGPAGSKRAPAYTASIDAALALVERLAPVGPMVSHQLSHSLARDGEEFWNFRIKIYSVDYEGAPPIIHWGTAWAAPIAILSALLSALTQDTP